MKALVTGFTVGSVRIFYEDAPRRPAHEGAAPNEGNRRNLNKSRAGAGSLFANLSPTADDRICQDAEL